MINCAIRSQYLHWDLGASTLACLLALSVSAHGASFEFVVNEPMDHDYGLQLELPTNFGSGEFTLELWIKPNHEFPIGPTTSGPSQLINWCDRDNEPYSSNNWWFDGNFLLDGHNNAAFRNGTFSLQFYGGGRVRWLFGDGERAGPGGHWSIGAWPAETTPSLLDGQWHHIAMVRRWDGNGGAELELWIDGSMVDMEATPVRTDMRTWWDGWAGFPSNQEGWFWGAEKQAAIGNLNQYEDYKGLIDELRLWAVARSASDLADNWTQAVSDAAPGLSAYYKFEEGTGYSACDSLEPSQCIQLYNVELAAWSADNAPVTGDIDGDGVLDESDNCTQVPNPRQVDTNTDGYGNVCDPDLDDNGLVNFADLSILGSVFFSTIGGANYDPDADFDSDGAINFADLLIMKTYFFGPPGPNDL